MSRNYSKLKSRASITKVLRKIVNRVEEIERKNIQFTSINDIRDGYTTEEFKIIKDEIVGHNENSDMVIYDKVEIGKYIEGMFVVNTGYNISINNDTIIGEEQSDFFDTLETGSTYYFYNEYSSSTISFTVDYVINKNKAKIVPSEYNLFLTSILVYKLSNTKFNSIKINEYETDKYIGNMLYMKYKIKMDLVFNTTTKRYINSIVYDTNNYNIKIYDENRMAFIDLYKDDRFESFGYRFDDTNYTDYKVGISTNLIDKSQYSYSDIIVGDYINFVSQINKDNLWAKIVDIYDNTYKIDLNIPSGNYRTAVFPNIIKDINMYSNSYTFVRILNKNTYNTYNLEKEITIPTDIEVEFYISNSVL